jgi:tetratricopeptide (TPR) repeat protein
LLKYSAENWENNRLDNPDLNTFIEELDEKLTSYEGLRGDNYRESLSEQYSLAKRFYGYLLKPDRVPDATLFDDVAMDMDADVMGWIVDLPFALSDYGGMVDEAVDICNLFAEVHSPDNFLGDMATILAEAGRREEALERIAKNLERFPDDAWIVIKAGQAYQTLKETDKALALYNRAYRMTSPLSYDRDGVLERLVPLLRELGRDDEADALIESEENAEKARKERYQKYEREETHTPALVDKQKPMPVTASKIGRNEPCPCGSGKKYKKCCGK